MSIPAITCLIVAAGLASPGDSVPASIRVSDSQAALAAAPPAATPLATAAAVRAADRLTELFGALHARDQFHGVVLVAEAGRVVHESAWGVADDARGEPVTPETRFEFASVSKPITAAAVLTLVADGRIGLDDPVVDHLPECPPAITVRHLLSHTSGLTDAGADRVAAEQPLDNAVVRRALGERRVMRVAAPGEMAVYANVNFVVAAELVAAVTGQPFAEAVAARVFDPAGMATAVVSDPLTWADARAGVATPYVRSPAGDAWTVAHTAPGWSFTVRLGGTRGDAGVVGTARDLLAFDRAWRAGRIVPPDLVAEAESPARAPDGTPFRDDGWAAAGYGLGWRTGRAGRTLFHTGDWGGFQANLTRRRDRDRTFIMLSSRRITDWSWMAEVDAILGDPTPWSASGAPDPPDLAEAAPSAAPPARAGSVQERQRREDDDPGDR